VTEEKKLWAIAGQMHFALNHLDFAPFVGNFGPPASDLPVKERERAVGGAGFVSGFTAPIAPVRRQGGFSGLRSPTGAMVGVATRWSATRKTLRQTKPPRRASQSPVSGDPGGVTSNPK